LYGGAGAIMLIDGQEDLSQPLNLDFVMPGSFRGLLVRDRWSGVYPGTELVENINSPDYGLPKYYKFDTQNTSFTVHHSRLLRFTGADLPLWEKQAEMYWGESEVEIIFEELKKRDNTSANIAMLVFMANLRILKSESLGEVLATGNQTLQRNLYGAIQAMNAMMNNNSLQVIGKNDDMLNYQYTFSGLNEIYESFMLDLAGAAEMPVTKIFGRSPQGMNATGESDAQNYSDMIGGRQDERLRPNLDKLLPVIAMSTWGFVPDDLLDFDFNPIEELNDKEKSEVSEKDTNTTIAAYNAGIVGRQTALKELRQQGNATNRWTNITDDTIAQADDEPTGGELPGINDLMGLGGELGNGLQPVGAQAENRGKLQAGVGKPDQKDPNGGVGLNRSG
jgi:phage-related protein (TIGR01555 family)